MSASVDVSDSLEEARTRLLKTARALTGAWAAALCSMAMMVVACLALLLVAVSMRPVYVIIWSVLLTATGYNLTRFWPRPRHRAGQRLTKQDALALRNTLDPHGSVDWPDVVRLVPRVELELSEGELVLGLPLLACLDHHELRELLALAARQASVEGDPSVRWALRLAHGEIGRALVGRRTRRTRLTAQLTEAFGGRAAQLEADLGNWAGACERAGVQASDQTGAAVAARDQIADAWALMSTEWLEPAFEHGRRHVAPFTGLRQFVEAADEAGWLKHSRPWWPRTGVVARIVKDYEAAVALQLDERGDRQPISWEQHATDVSVPQWRVLVAEALDAARRTSYDPAVTLDSLLNLLSSADGRASAEATESRTLAAAIGVSAIDSAQFRPCWSWPEGTALEARDGWILPVESMVTDVLAMVRDGGRDKAYTELRGALRELGIDVNEPLWLDRENSVRPERPVGSFAAWQGLAPRVVVVTDRALHVYRDSQRTRVGNPEHPPAPGSSSVELRRRMLMVWQGDMTEQVRTVAADDVRRARLGPEVGGLWWRLTLTGAGGTLVLRGRGDGSEEESEIKEWLGDRVETVWRDVPARVRTVRNAVGLTGFSFGTLALLWAVMLTIARPAGIPAALPSVLALAGFGALVVALVPDWAVQLRRGSRE